MNVLWSTINAITLVGFCVLCVWGTSFLKKKGELFATKKQCDELIKQTEEISKKTENIRLIAWRNQQYLTSREKYYMEILKHLTICRNTLSDRMNYYLEPGSEYDDNRINNCEHFKELSHKAHSSFLALRELTGPASVFLSDTTIESLNKLEREHWVIGEVASYCNKDYLESTDKLVKEAFSAVLSEAKEALKVLDREKTEMLILSRYRDDYQYKI